MAKRVRMTLDQAITLDARRSPQERAARHRRIEAASEDEIRRQMIEDGEDPEEDVPADAGMQAQSVRRKLGMTQAEFANFLRIPLATLRNWEQGRCQADPAAQTLLKLVYDEPDAARRVLRARRAA